MVVNDLTDNRLTSMYDVVVMAVLQRIADLARVNSSSTLLHATFMTQTVQQRAGMVLKNEVVVFFIDDEFLQTENVGVVE